MQPKQTALPWLALSALLIGLDWLSKQWALSALQYQQPVEVIAGFWNWTLVHNTGAAFSLLADAGGWQQWFFGGLALLISGACIWMLAKAARSDWRTALPLALIVGGALGNLIDRIRFGYVVDFVHWYWRDFHWPVFNLADAVICIAAGLLIVTSFRPETKKVES
jgi:signal peptidase II